MLLWRAAVWPILFFLLLVTGLAGSADGDHHQELRRTSIEKKEESAAEEKDEGAVLVSHRRTIRPEAHTPLRHGGGWFHPLRNRASTNPDGSSLGATPPSEQEEEGRGSKIRHAFARLSFMRMSPIQLPPAEEQCPSPIQLAPDLPPRGPQVKVVRSYPAVPSSLLSEMTSPPSTPSAPFPRRGNQVKMVRSIPAVSPLASEGSEELRAHFEETRLRRNPGSLNIRALAATMSPFGKNGPAVAADSNDELSESDRSETSEDRTDGSSPAVRQSWCMRDDHQKKQLQDS